ncbi:MAG: prolipoprotein diacylglyceryl transferase [Candidatus Protistobacter heckmanni]|nr:prolipoprotein diacylglyceryl transferase [Candidatus Protistobacter heckmanni]
MLIHPQFDPVALQIGPLAVRWYGLMYLIGFGFFLWLGRIRIRQPQYAAAGWTARDLDDMLMFGVFGVILGGRLGYVLFYKLGDYLAHPASIFHVWEGGMSFHGGFLGLLAAVALFARLRGRGFLEITDLIAPLIPAGLAAGRLGNFINGELWGRPTDVPWAMIFPQAGDNLPRHPSQLYQFAGEGLVLLVLLWLYARKPRPLGAVSGMFLIGYGCLRFLAEFAREPDNFLGLLALGMSMGQWLSLPMVLLGVYMLRRSARQGFTA